MIIGITGSFAAGKGTVVDYLVEKKGFTHYSAREFLFEEIRKRGMPLDRESLIVVGNDLRAQFGPAYVVESLYKRALEKGGDAVIESLRTVAEVKKIKELGGAVWGVDADSHLRFDRAMKRKSETDNVTYEQWVDQERRESNPDDPTKQDIFGALKESDTILNNNGSEGELIVQVEAALASLTH